MKKNTNSFFRYDTKIIGIDLAGKPENPTGICFLNKNKLNFLLFLVMMTF